jgi:hypothetical protein
MTYDYEAIVRRAYHAAEGSVLDVAGFADAFAKDELRAVTRSPQSAKGST